MILLIIDLYVYIHEKHWYKKKIFTIEWKIASNHKYILFQFNKIFKLHLYLSILIRYSIRGDNKDNNEYLNKVLKYIYIYIKLLNSYMYTNLHHEFSLFLINHMHVCAD